MNIIQKLVTEDKLKHAIDLLLKCKEVDKNAIAILSGRNSEIDRKELLKLESPEYINIERNRIRNATLEYGKSYEPILYEKALNVKLLLNSEIEKIIGIGNEPGWSLRVSNQTIIFVSVYGTETHAYEITNVFLGNGIYHIRSDKPLSMDNRYISVTITQEPWSDDMSGKEFPYRVEITENFHHYIGVGLIKE
ncbi:MAG: hypothetical protein ACRBFS_14750 [Aureispira sp.]